MSCFHSVAEEAEIDSDVDSREKRSLYEIIKFKKEVKVVLLTKRSWLPLLVLVLLYYRSQLKKNQ
jgi:hypothetical protein